MSCLGTQQQDLFTDDQDFRHVFVLIVQKLVFVSERGRFHQVLNLGGIVKEVNPWHPLLHPSGPDCHVTIPNKLPFPHPFPFPLSLSSFPSLLNFPLEETLKWLVCSMISGLFTNSCFSVQFMRSLISENSPPPHPRPLLQFPFPFSSPTLPHPFLLLPPDWRFGAKPKRMQCDHISGTLLLF